MLFITDTHPVHVFDPAEVSLTLFLKQRLWENNGPLLNNLNPIFEGSGFEAVAALAA